MSKSLINIDKSCIFRETFNNSQAVSSNRYSKGTISSTGVKFENNTAKISRTEIGFIKYKGFSLNSNQYTIRIKGNLTDFVNAIDDAYLLLEVSTDPNVSTNNNSISVAIGNEQGLSNNLYATIKGNSSFIHVGPSVIKNNPTSTRIYDLNKHDFIISVSSTSISYYIDGKLKTSFNFTSEPVNFSKYPIFIGLRGLNSAYGSNFNYDLIEIYNRSLSISEVKLIYQQQLYSSQQQTSLLLDFDSTKGLVEDRTGRNKLTSNDIVFKKIGKYNSAYFNGTSSKIDCGSNIITNKHVLINMWVKHNIKSSSDNNVLCSIANDSGFLVIYSTSLPIFSKALIVTNNGSSISGKNNMYDIERKFTNIIVDRKPNGYFNVWVNGILQINILLNAPSYSYNTNFTIGYSTGSTNAYKGYIPKLQIYDATDMNDNQISSLAYQLYNSQSNLFS